MSDYDYTARRRASDAQSTADEAQRSIRALTRSFEQALERIKKLEAEVETLKAELAPKTIDKKRNPLKPKDQ